MSGCFCLKSKGVKITWSKDWVRIRVKENGKWKIIKEIRGK